jgi:hypothetical protein
LPDGLDVVPRIDATRAVGIAVEHVSQEDETEAEQLDHWGQPA